MGGALQQAAFDANRCESERQTDRLREREYVCMYVASGALAYAGCSCSYTCVLVSICVTRMYMSCIVSFLGSVRCRPRKEIVSC